ncbi:hypothetical protein OSB04_007610 [Centaurea solstitialis]|uniref:Reverse transcriptase domain-containing protein n=1 Tax=Centaurea solstitialis TaxID=347529 RepID=A0AA38TWU9_9ASTR|nr:hypothetical protein OSB04_007610 [Centaurea solstitialis]
MNTRDALAIGSDTRPPVLFRGDFSQWKSRFLDFVAKQPLHKQIMESLRNGPVKYYTEIPAVPDGNPPIVGGRVEKNDTNFTPEEVNRVRGDILAKSYLIQSLPNEIYANIDCNDTEKGIQMKRTNLLTKFATFKGREGELLEDTYHRFCTMINELRKSNLKKSQLDINIQFINSLRSEWRRFASNIQQNRNLEDLDIHELFELLNHNQDEVLEILGTEKKAEKYADPLALVVDRRHYHSGKSTRYEDDYDVPSDTGEKGSESDEEMNDIKRALALITRSMSKRNARKPMSSNNHRYSSGRRYEPRDRYESRNDARRYEKPAEFDTRRYDDQRDRRYEVLGFYGYPRIKLTRGLTQIYRTSLTILGVYLELKEKDDGLIAQPRNLSCPELEIKRELQRFHDDWVKEFACYFVKRRKKKKKKKKKRRKKKES